MDSDDYSQLPLALPSSDLVKCCDCGCSCYLGGAGGVSSGSSWFRTVKRKYDEFEGPGRFFVPGLDLALNLNPNARVQIENECDALRETLGSQQAAIQDLYTELEEERNASSSAANEAMSMILRLQREKAEVQMEARQFKRFAEEKMAHDQQELVAMEDLLYKREQTIQSLTCEVQAYKHRMLSYGLTESEIEGEKGRFSRNTSMTENLDGAQFDFPVYDYPPLKCSINENPTPCEGDDDIIDIEKYAPGETPRARNLKNLEYRICQMEKTPRNNQMNGDLSGPKNVLEKIIVGHSPRRPKHNRRFSEDSSNSFFGETRVICNDIETGSPNFRANNSFKKMDYFPKEEEHPTTRKLDNAWEFADDTSDRVYTIDSVHNGATSNGAAEPKPGLGAYDDYLSSPREPDFSDPDIKKLYARLHALEADRESMRQAIISMRTDKAQLVLLKEIAQHLCKDMTPERPVPIKKPTVARSFRLISVFKWIVSFMFWRKTARHNNEQRRLAHAIRQKPPFKAVEVPVKYTSVSGCSLHPTEPEFPTDG